MNSFFLSSVRKLITSLPKIYFKTFKLAIMRKKIFFLSALLIATSAIYHPSIAAVIDPSTNIVVPGKPDPVKVKAAVDEFKNLSRKERRERIKEVKAEIRHYKADKKAGNEPNTNTLLLCILAILLPPLAVYLHEGVINNKFWISLILTLLLWLPGVIYALVVVLGGA